MMKLNDGFLSSMREAMTVLRNNGPVEATKAIKRALCGDKNDAGDATALKTGAEAQRQTQADKPTSTQAQMRVQTQVQQHLDRFTEAMAAVADLAPAPIRPDVQERGNFSTHTFSNAAGQRQYKLYIPDTTAGGPLPLIIMLHGCTQDADDFAAGTQMNALAERHRCMVVYPIQPQKANISKCWNWFTPADQHRDKGEPSLIAGITREVMAHHNVDPARVYVAGLSAGGSMADVMIRCYPDVYAAAGVHSGLPYGSAHDLPSALAAMKGGRRMGQALAPNKTQSAYTPKRPLIVFHGDADTTVNLSNALQLVQGYDEKVATRSATPSIEPNRRVCAVKWLTSSEGYDAELWVIHGAPHAWSGGSASGSYTDPKGPDASAEMMRFFLAHPMR